MSAKEKNEFSQLWVDLKAWFLKITSKDLSNRFIPILIFITVGLIIYSNVLNGDFIYDDIQSISGNYQLRNFGNFLKTLSLSNYRFVGYLSFALNYQLHQIKPFGYHLTNLIIHIITTILIYQIVVLTLQSSVFEKDKIRKKSHWLAFLIALVFLVHPLQTEAVSYMVQRLTSMASLFYLLSIYLYIKARLNKIRNKQLFLYLGCIISGLLGLYTKEIVFSLPLVLIAYDFYFLSLQNTKEKLIKLSYFIIPLVIFIGLAFIMYKPAYVFGNKLSKLDEIITPLNYFLTQFRVIVKYLQLLIFPYNQNLDYYFPLSQSLFEFKTFLSFILILIIFALIIIFYKKYRILSFAIIWFFLTLSVESSFIPIPDVIYEHRLYLPILGFCLFIVIGLNYLFKNKFRYLLYMVFGLSLIFAILTFERNKVWIDEETLWKDVVKKSPQVRRVYNNLGAVLVKNNKYQEALYYLNQAIKIRPNYLSYNNIGLVFIKLGQFEKAKPYLLKANEIEPNYISYNNLGLIAIQQKDFQQAVKYLKTAVALESNYAKAWNNLGFSFAGLKQYDQALQAFQKAIDLDPNYAEAKRNFLKVQKFKTSI